MSAPTTRPSRRLAIARMCRECTTGRPADPGISRAIANTRKALARYVGNGGHVPAWFPPSLVHLLEAPTA